MARRPFLLDASQAIASPGVRHHHRVTAPLGGVELPAARVGPTSDVRVDVVLEAQGSTVVADGTAVATWEGECRRCLNPTSGTVEIEFREIYADDPVEGETYPLVDQRVDLGPMLQEALALALPLAPLCAEDCPGPDPEAHPVGSSGAGAGENGTGEEAGPNGTPAEDHEPVDDRWAALDRLHLEDGES